MDILKIDPAIVHQRLLIAGCLINHIRRHTMKTEPRLKPRTPCHRAPRLVDLPADLVVLAVVTDDFRTEVLAALLGTVAGYVLSQSTAGDQ